MGRMFAALTAASLFLLGCNANAEQPSEKAVGRAKTLSAPPATNVVIFLIDTLRADRLGCYGYDKPTSPTLDLLASEGVLFENAHAAAPWTCPSIPSLMTSTFPCEHGITTENTKLSPKIRTMAERFKAIDYHTASFYINVFAGPKTGMDRGFDICEENPQRTFSVDGRRVWKWRNERPADKPFFLYVHNIEPHNPFRAPPDLIPLFGEVRPQTPMQLGKLINMYRQVLRADWDRQVPLGTVDTAKQCAQVLNQTHALLDEHLVLYDATVRDADRKMASVIDALKKQGAWDNTMFIVLSDHGEEMAERGDYLHSQSLYDELTHVPLIVRFPNKAFAGTRVSDVVSLVDVLPTIFDYLGKPEQNAGARGESLLPLITGEANRDGRLVVTSVRINEKKYRRAWAPVRGNNNVAVHTGDGLWKGIWNVDSDTMELYHRPSDPMQRVNHCADEPDLADDMQQFAKAFWEECSTGNAAPMSAPPTASEMDVLREMGYVGSDGSEDVDLDDLRRPVELDLIRIGTTDPRQPACPTEPSP